MRAYRDKSSGNLLTLPLPPPPPASDLCHVRLDLHSPNSFKKRKKEKTSGHSISRQNPPSRRLEVGENKIKFKVCEVLNTAISGTINVKK